MAGLTDLTPVLLVGVRVVLGLVLLAALVSAGWEQRQASKVLYGLAQTAVMRTEVADRRGVIMDLAHGTKHYQRAVDALWVALAALVVTWWLW